MLSIQDVIDYCDLDRGEIEAIAEHEHIPDDLAAELSERHCFAHQKAFAACTR
jgi:hypothetical protein